MIIEEKIPLLEAILAEWKGIIGHEYNGYRNHVYRMINFCFCLKPCSDEEKEKIIIAAAFHDIGIWIEDTIDYIPSSIPPAVEYLKKNNLESWVNEISLMISEHHKIREYAHEKYPLVEIFRKGDLVDFSLGLVKFGVPGSCLERVKEKFPNSGFHENLVKRAVKWFLRHPLNPVPMMKW
ncbi:MAG: HD domain-containing protein [Deltaproteobacteria bacterium]|nr:HD domain-containing protein [Deltaproteobacteria bacterium]